MPSAGYVIAIDGCPYAFGTTNVRTPQHSDWSLNWTLVQSSLEAPNLKISQEFTLIDAQYNGSSATFTLLDVPVTINGTVRNLMTWLGTRENQGYAELVDVTSTTFELSQANSFASGAIIVWIGQEAILVNRTGTTLTTAQRGYYSSPTQDHEVTEPTPTLVFSEFPGFDRRRVTLFRVLGDGSTTIAFRGYASNGVRTDDEGSRFTLACDDVWTVQGSENVNIPNAYPLITGIDKRWIELGFNNVKDDNNSISVSGIGGVQDRAQEIAEPNPPAISTTYTTELMDVLSFAASRLQVTTNSPPINLSARIQASRDQNADNIIISAALTTTSSPSLTVSYGNTKLVFPEASRTAANFVTVKAPVPNYKVFHPLQPFNTEGPSSLSGSYLHVDDSSVLPDAIAPFTGSDGVIINSSLLASFNDTWDVRFNLQEKYDYPNNNRILLQKGNTVTWIPKSTTRNVPPTPQFITEPQQLQFKKILTAPHFLYGFKNLINEFSSDPRNWNFGGLSRDTAVTTTAFSAVEWTLDNSLLFRDIIEEYSKLFLMILAPYFDEQLKFRPIVYPTALDSPVLTLTSKDYVAKPIFDTDMVSYSNTFKVSSDLLPDGLIINNQASKGRFGNGKTIEIDTKKLLTPSLLFDSYSSLENYASYRLFGYYSKPLRVASVTVPYDVGASIFIGDLIRVSDWLIPNGEGSRSLNGALCTIIGKDKQIGGDRETITFSFIVWDRRRGSGYSPCFRVSSISGAVVTVQSTDYFGTGSESETYNGAGSGLEYLTAGDAVKLVLRNTTSNTMEDFEVLSVNVFTKEVTLTSTVPSSPTDWVTLAATGFVDMKFSQWDFVEVSQQKWLFIGANGLINFGDQPSYEWIP